MNPPHKGNHKVYVEWLVKVILCSQTFIFSFAGQREHKTNPTSNQSPGLDLAKLARFLIFHERICLPVSNTNLLQLNWWRSCDRIESPRTTTKWVWYGEIFLAAEWTVNEPLLLWAHASQRRIAYFRHTFISASASGLISASKSPGTHRTLVTCVTLNITSILACKSIFYHFMCITTVMACLALSVAKMQVHKILSLNASCVDFDERTEAALLSCCIRHGVAFKVKYVVCYLSLESCLFFISSHKPNVLSSMSSNLTRQRATTLKTICCVPLSFEAAVLRDYTASGFVISSAGISHVLW